MPELVDVEPGSPEPIRHCGYPGCWTGDCTSYGTCLANGRTNVVRDIGGRDAVTEWREELGYDPITGEAL